MEIPGKMKHSFMKQRRKFPKKEKKKFHWKQKKIISLGKTKKQYQQKEENNSIGRKIIIS